MGSPVLYIVRATITADCEQAWNDRYDAVHPLEMLIRDHDARFGPVSERRRSAYVRVSPPEKERA